MTAGIASETGPRRARTIAELLSQLVLGIMLPILAFAIFALWQHTEQNRKLANEAALGSATDLAHDIDREMSGVASALYALASSPALKIDDFATFAAQAQSVSGVMGAMILLRDAATGAQIVNTRVPAGQPLPKGGHTEVSRQVIATKTRFVSNVAIGQLTNRPLVSVAVPVIRDGVVISVLLGSFDPEPMAALIGSRPDSPDRSTLLVDRRGVVVMRSGSAAAMGEMSSVTERPVSAPSIERYTDGKGVPVVRAYRQTTFGWTAITITPTAVIDSPLHSSWWLFLIAGTTLVIIAFALTARLARRIGNAVRNVALNAAALERGDVVPRATTGVVEADGVMRALHTTSLTLRERTRALAKSAARVNATFDQAAIGFAHMDLTGRWVKVNDRFCTMLGRTRAECLELARADVTHVDDRAADRLRIEQVATGVLPNTTCDIRFLSGDGRTICVRATTSLIRAADGTPLHFLSLFEDVTDAQVTANARAKLAALVEAASDVMISVAPGDIIEAVNPIAAEFTGIAAAQLPSAPLISLFPSGSVGKVEALLQSAWRGEAARIETTLLRAGSDPIDVAVVASPIFSDTRSITGLAVTIEDIQIRKRWEAQLLLLNRELQHRIKNSLAVVQSIANQTLRSSATMAAFRTAFTGRLQALARANDLPLRSSWQGDDLRALVEKQVHPLLSDPESQLAVTGADLVLPSDLAVPVSLALHELGTNAVKHGALSATNGRIELRWHIVDADDSRDLVLSWREMGGPPVETPRRLGFGSTLIVRGIPGATVDTQFSATGLECEMRISLRHFEDAPAAMVENREAH